MIKHDSEVKLIHVIFDLLNDLNNDISYESKVLAISKISDITKLNERDVTNLFDFYTN